MSNISSLAEKNTCLIQELGFDPLQDDPFDLDNPDVFRSSGLFENDAVDAIFGIRDIPLPDILTQYVKRDIGMLLIRPDMVHISDSVIKRMGQEYSVLDVADTVVTPSMYWQMYSDAVISRETHQSRFTRAAVYINSTCKLIVLTDLGQSEDEKPLANTLVDKYKGHQGVYQPGTLRGELVYEAAIDSGFHTLEDDEVALAVDPFGAYRKIIANNEHGSHSPLVYPLLCYTGVGIHIPDYNEIQRDLRVFDSQKMPQC